MATEERQWTDAERWYRERYSATPERRSGFTTLSGEPIRPLYSPEDVGSFEERIGFAGEYPFTRGVSEHVPLPAVDDAPVRGTLQSVWGSYTETPVF